MILDYTMYQGMKNDTLSLKNALKRHKSDLFRSFYKHASITAITHRLVAYVDTLLMTLFEKHALSEGGAFSLLALGGYGRQELQLYSDIDILLLHEDETSPERLLRAQQFIQDCWDIGLEVSHQLTTIKDCALLASQDLTVISSILDLRFICGKGTLMEELLYETHPLHIWPSPEYFSRKREEQQQRYKKYDGTAYNLEPNVKYGPGGLRDLQILLNISKRHFGLKKLADGISCGFITDKEYEELIHAQHFLWRIRFALHHVAEKNEERLLFDHQVKLATLFGYKDEKHSLGIEQFMKAYFKNIKRIRELNDMLLQWFSEAIVEEPKQKLTPLDPDFQLSNTYIEVRHPKVFVEDPAALMHLFLWIATYPQIEGIRAGTLRLIRQHLYLINKRFCSTRAITNTFIAILKQENPYPALHRMSRSGVLDHYLPCYAAVTGQMQYDLFHVYTVDQHTLFVIRNIASFQNNTPPLPFPLCSKLIKTIAHRDILYLAAFFHDIAKGRGGDHSELGALEASQFSARHHLGTNETALLVWLVEHHLLMSETAQRKDIYDPSTITLFCSQLPKSSYLDYLYLLTVADICATNPVLWTTWKDSLLKELYRSASLAMEQAQISLNETTLVTLRQQEALCILCSQTDLTPETVETLWRSIDKKYFLHESSQIIARHTEAILECSAYPLVLIMPHHNEGGTEVFIYMPHRDERLAITTTVLSNHHATIQEASILTNANHFDLDIYVILDEHNQIFFDPSRTESIQQDLITYLRLTKQLPTLTQRRLSRTQAHFKSKPTVTFQEDPRHSQTCLFLIAADRPGLLATVSRIFLTERIYLHHAKIATAGERAEDMFYISTEEGLPLSPEAQEKIRQKFIDEL